MYGLKILLLTGPQSPLVSLKILQNMCHNNVLLQSVHEANAAIEGIQLSLVIVRVALERLGGDGRWQKMG